MGWKTSLIIITSTPEIEDQRLLNILGLKGSTPKSDIVFEDTTGFHTDKVSIGRYNGNLIICEWSIPEKVIQNNQTDIERILMDSFPYSEICFIQLVSTVNFWGYKLIDNGKVLRHRAGDGQRNGTYFDIGEPLAQEKELLAKSYFDEAGNRLYIFEDDPNEIYTEDQVGEEFVFKLCARYLGLPLDEDDEFLYGIKFSCYQKRSWWQFWK